ncbi:MAG TPA: DNA repair exonuclease [Rhodopila sp.]|uniref:metallophosphoesterase family protein n=1 Tax=Rhodopila sp. TaxID=2480087 RepID=UPI002C2E8BE9|nr:DNA repair exonuclease [Rhodopila sp.]HVY15292.1 DNA repair exonuclease [Rhodopila sp.]
MKFLHAADIHLDSPLKGLASNDRIPGDITRHCTRRAFSNLIDLAIAEDVAFLIIAGDLYDGDWRDYSTGLFFIREMHRLARPCFLIRGNHDARSLITRNLTLPDNVREFSSRAAQTIHLPEHRVALHGRSFPDRTVPEDLSVAYPDRVPDCLNIGLLHTSAEDPAGEHDTYAPCRIEGLIAKGYDYWALGHIHQRATLHPGEPWIVFPGNLQGRHAHEPGGKGATLVTVRDGAIVGVEHRDLDVLRWAAVDVDLTDTETMAEVAAKLRFELEAATRQADGRPLIVRVTLTGATACHGALAADPHAIDAETRAAAAGISGMLHVEKLRLRTTPPPRLAYQDDDLAVLRRTFLDALDDPDIARRLLAEFAALDGLVPAADRNRARPPLDADQLRALAGDAWAVIETRLAEDATKGAI